MSVLEEALRGNRLPIMVSISMNLESRGKTEVVKEILRQ